MSKTAGWLAAVVLGAIALGGWWWTHGVKRDTVHFEDLGDTHIYRLAEKPGRLVLLLSDTQGETSGELDHLARKLAKQGFTVSAINADNFLNAANKDHWDCLNAVTLLDVYSQSVQEDYKFEHYQRPLLVGQNSASSFVYMLLAQAPQKLFQGALTLGLCPQANFGTPPCAGSQPLKWQKSGARFDFQPLDHLAAPLSVVASADMQCGSVQASPFVKPLQEQGTLLSLSQPPSAHNLQDWLPELVRLSEIVSPPEPDSVDDLPLVELPSRQGKEDFVAIIISGDGGWANIDRDIGEGLNRQGIDVVGWNALQYFWNPRNPDGASADLARTIRHYQQRWHKKKVLLVGFSLGADVLPFMISRLPPEQRADIASVVLLGLSHAADFQFHVTDWLGSDSSAPYQLAPEMPKLAGLQVQCIYGSEDDDTLCPELDKQRYIVVQLPGDHHFDGDYQTVINRMLAPMTSQVP